MTSFEQLERAQLLIAQKRPNDALTILKDLLKQNPTDFRALAMMAEVKISTDEFQEAESLIDNAIQVSPNESALFYIKSRVSFQLDKDKLADESIQEAIRLDPYDADYFAFWAHLKLHNKENEIALNLADQALSFDPENIMALNCRSKALIKLDRKTEAFQTIEGALNHDPNNAYTHANYGFGLLEKGDSNKALHHFTEALKNDPNSAHAQYGMAEALKARYWLYRVYLKYIFWMSNLTAKYQAVFIFGIFFAQRFLNTLARQNETLRPFILPIIIGLSVFVFSSWIFRPVSNLFLRLNKFGVHLLDESEVKSSNFVGISAAIGIIGLIGYLTTSYDVFLAMAIVGFFMMIPCSHLFSPSKYKYVQEIYTFGLAIIGLLCIKQYAQPEQEGIQFDNIFFLGIFIFTFVSTTVSVGGRIAK
jgi:Tfp pilus assembly protein PilF